MYCIGRLAQHLPFSLLEVMTVSFITESTFIIFFWWHKPGDVCSRLRLEGPNLDEDTVEQMFQATDSGISAAMLKDMRIPLGRVSRRMAGGVQRLLTLGVISILMFSVWPLTA